MGNTVCTSPYADPQDRPFFRFVILAVAASFPVGVGLFELAVEIFYHALRVFRIHRHIVVREREGNRKPELAV